MFLFASLEGKRGNIFGNKKWGSGRNRGNWKEELWWVYFHRYVKSSSFKETQNVLEKDFGEFVWILQI